MASYNNITLVSGSGNNFSWNYPYAEGGIILGDINDLNTSGVATAYMPDATLTSIGTIILFNNKSAYPITIATYAAALNIVTIPSASSVEIYLTDNTNTNRDGVWGVLQLTGEGTSGITGLTVGTSTVTPVVGPALTFTGSPVIGGESGNIGIGLNKVLTNFSTLASQGIMVSTTIDGTAIVTRSIVSDSNLVISNANGVAGNINISLAESISTNQVNVGEIQFTASGLSSSTSNIQITTTGTGSNVNMNGLTVDTSGNVTTIGTVTGSGDTTVTGTLSVSSITSSAESGDITITSGDPSGLINLNGVTIDDSGNIANAGTLTSKGITNTGNIANTGDIANTGTISNIGDAAITGTLNVATVTSNTTNGNVAITSTGTGKVNLNGLTVDTSGDIANAGSITSTGSFHNTGTLINTGDASITGTLTVPTITSTTTLGLNGLTVDSLGNITNVGNIVSTGTITATNINIPGNFSSQAFFSDTNNLSQITAGTNIALGDSQNIASVLGSNGQYNVLFIKPYTTATYVAQVTLDNSLSTFQPVFTFSSTKSTTGLTIQTLDKQGNLAPATGGVNLSVFGTFAN